jgi:TolA-binding protein
MARLSPEAEEIVRATRAALRPSNADRERVFQALSSRLDGTLGAEGMNESVRAPAAAKAIAAKISAVLIGLGVAGGGLFLALDEEEQPPATTAGAPAGPAPAAPAPVDEAPVDEARADKAPEDASSVVPKPRLGESRTPATTNRLAQEVAILSRASSELHAGRPAAALKALDEHQRKFPSGVLAQERTAARVRALCAMGRTGEAQVEFARLARTSPRSPHVARARKACGFSPTEEH